MKIKLGSLGYLGFLGFFGFIEPELFNLFFLFFLFFLDVIPDGKNKISGKVAFTLLILAVVIGNVLQIKIIGILSNIFFAGIVIYIAYTFFYPVRRGKMKPEIVPLLRDPVTHEPLQIRSEPDTKGKEQEVLACIRSGRKFPIRDGIPVFLDESKVTGLNKKYQIFYNLMAPFYDLFQKMVYVFFGGEKKFRMQYLKGLEIKEGAKVLEVSVGTGGNLHYLSRRASCFGLDISWGMLKQCQKNLTRWGIDAYLFHGEAEQLPFEDEVFDVVFHVGGINFFNDKKAAIDEMVRVAKSGTKILIADETEKLAESGEKIPGFGAIYRKEAISIPVDLVPHGMHS